MHRDGLIAGGIALVVGVAACQPSPAVPSVSPSSAPTPAVSASTATSPRPSAATPVIALDPAEMDARYDAALPLFDYDAGAPLELERTSSRDQGDFTIEDVSYASPAGGRVTALLVTPASPGGHAGLIVLHGSGGTRNDLLREGQRYAALGVLVLLIDAPFARRPGQWIRFTETDRDEQIQLMLDLRRGVDVLLEAGAAEDGIGFLGYSYGAAMGSGLSGIERRIRAYVLDVGDGGLVSHFTGSDDVDSPLTQMSADRRAAWLAAMEPIEPLYFVRHAAPSDLLFQSGRMDQLIPVEDAERLHQQASEPKTILWYESDHGLPPAAWCDQVDWLRDRLAFDDRPWAPSCA